MQLAMLLSHSEKNDWHNQYRGNDRVQKECTEARYTHYFVHSGGLMQEGQDVLYSRQKQSKVQCFQVGPSDAQWADWESTSEFDTDINDEVENLTSRLQTQANYLRALQEQQMPDKATAQLVAQVVPPVAVTTPVPPLIDMDMLPAGAAPGTTLGPGQPARGMDMPELFAESEDEQQAWEQRKEDEAE